jgi:hypothetical protein
MFREEYRPVACAANVRHSRSPSSAKADDPVFRSASDRIENRIAVPISEPALIPPSRKLDTGMNCARASPSAAHRLHEKRRHQLQHLVQAEGRNLKFLGRREPNGVLE